MKKLFVYMLAGAGVFASAAYADGYKPFYPVGGINSGTTVPQVYSDGSTGTLAQIGQMADSSVQQTDIGTTVAPLDANKRMPSPVSGDSSLSPATTSGTTTPRTLASRFSDYINLADQGGDLVQTQHGLDTIQAVYDKSPDRTVIHIPNWSTWHGTLESSDPNKNLTWIFDGTYDFTGWEHTPGDGDATISHKYGMQVSRMDTNTKNWRQSPLIAFYWNDDSNYCGAYCSNWGQQSAAAFSAISGPTAQGNTSPATFAINSYGNNPSSSYDVGMPVTVFKYGQNSIWGLDISTNDYSGKSPSAFATWNEFDMWTNGYDVKPWDLGYGAPQAGHRSVFYVTVAHENAQLVNWSAQTGMSAHATGKGSIQVPSLLNVKAPSGTSYIWYPVANGTTGTTEPTFPDPAKINGTISKGTLTVTRIVDGTISVGDTVTGANPVNPVKITGQTSGTSGGVGVYTVDDTGASSNTNEALYVAPLITDGSVTWQFGEETNSTISSVLWVTSSPGDAVDTVVGVDGNTQINNSALNTELAKMGPNAAVVRMASGQPIDFTGNGTAAGQNQHTISYSEGGLQYNVAGNTVRKVWDDGTITTPHSAPNSAGTTIDDATVVAGPLIVVSSSADGAGVKLDGGMGNEGRTERVVNNSIHTLNVYPINGAWAFIGHNKGQPILLPAYSSLTVTTISNYDCVIYAEYHPAAP